MLKKIVDYKRKEIKESKASISFSEIKKRLKDVNAATRDFKKALLDNGKRTRIIAEIKKASPSRGIISKDFKPIDIAKIYENNGAKAISVLTEKKFFEGDLKFISQIKKEVSLPILRKDFIIDPYQIYETRLFGGDAILLIVSILDQKQLKDFISLSKELSMECLVEVHNDLEMEGALKSDCSIIGINNRDLKTFKTDINTTLRLIKKIPIDRIVVSESGIERREDIALLKDAGVHAFLIGEALIKENNIAHKLRYLIDNS
ncbi:MAG TPA: indole-3-glycerol phosphate synthase TrpC [Nitrospinota bacterium]|nr:indole-3-glycerol phosphate synthase TrpC [Nitrospinota bacterium]